MEHCMFNNDPFCERDFLNPGNNTMTWYDYTNLFLMTSIIYATGFCVSSWIIGKYMLVPLPEKKEIKKKYQDKYSLDDMEKDISRNSEVTKNTSVLEKTPNGIVIMRYNKDREGFEYWCNDKNIKYDYLETVARKFVIMNFHKIVKIVTGILGVLGIVFLFMVIGSGDEEVKAGAAMGDYSTVSPLISLAQVILAIAVIATLIFSSSLKSFISNHSKKSLLKHTAILIISAIPAENSLGGKVDKKEGSISTAFG